MGKRKQLKVLRRIANPIYALKHIKLGSSVEWEWMKRQGEKSRGYCRGPVRDAEGQW